MVFLKNLKVGAPGGKKSFKLIWATGYGGGLDYEYLYYNTAPPMRTVLSKNYSIIKQICLFYVISQVFSML